MSFEALKLHVGHRSVVFTYRSVFERFNCKWPLYSVTANHVHENCLCRCGTEECQTKQSEMPQWTAYHWRTPKVSGRREIYCWCCFCSVRSVSPLSNIYGLVLVKCRQNVANKLFISCVFNPRTSPHLQQTDSTTERSHMSKRGRSKLFFSVKVQNPHTIL